TRYTSKCIIAKVLAPSVNTSPQGDLLQPTPAPAEPTAAAGDTTAHQLWLAARQNWL
ncbi:unnamed protein product, partial [Bubo scandiacus]